MGDVKEWRGNGELIGIGGTRGVEAAHEVLRLGVPGGVEVAIRVFAFTSENTRHPYIYMVYLCSWDCTHATEGRVARI